MRESHGDFYPPKKRRLEETSRDDRDRYSSRDNRQEEIVTIHISGFPANASQRELNNFCNFLPGLVQSTGKIGSRPIVFARFEYHDQALRAIDRLNGFVFDETDPHDSVLKTSLANRNFVQPNKNNRDREFQVDSRLGPREARAPSHLSSRSYRSRSPERADPYDSRRYFGGGSSNIDSSNRRSSVSSDWGRSVEAPAGSGSGAGLLECKWSGPPIDTLCVRGLNASQSKADLTQLFGQAKGFQLLTFLRSKGLAFVKFGAADDAQAALASLHRRPCPRATGPVVVEFARRSLLENANAGGNNDIDNHHNVGDSDGGSGEHNNHDRPHNFPGRPSGLLPDRVLSDESLAADISNNNYNDSNNIPRSHRLDTAVRQSDNPNSPSHDAHRASSGTRDARLALEPGEGARW